MDTGGSHEPLAGSQIAVCVEEGMVIKHIIMYCAKKRVLAIYIHF